MKKNFVKWAGILIAVAFLLPTTMTVNAEEESIYYYDQPEIVLNYSFQEPDITQVIINDTWYDHVTIDDLPTFNENATPLLPIKPVNVLLPQRGKLESITVTYNDNISLGTGFNVELGSEPVILDTTPEDGGTVDIKFDPTIPYPVEIFHVVETYDFRGYSIMTFNLFPVHYIGETGELYYYPEMTVEITTTDSGVVNPYFRGLTNDEELMKQKVDDYSMSSSYVFPAEQPLPSSLVDPSESYMYVIITNNELKNSFQTLKDHKTLRGISTEIVTVEEIAACYDYWWIGEYGDGLPHFSDLQCRIRNFIKDAYMNWETEYILLGGDDDIMPHRGFYCMLPLLETDPIDKSDIPADMYYACLDGNFDRNLNDKWADLRDKPDLRAEVYVGRACISTIEEAENFISKTLAYETTIDPYLENVWMVGEYLGFGGIADFGGNYKDEIIDGSDANEYTTVGIPSDEYNISTLYDRDWPGHDWPKSEIINIINNDIHIINHLGHAYYDYNMKLGISDADTLTNDKYCFIYSQGCMAGGFDNPEGYDCIAEHLTVRNNHGAFAGIWNSRYGIGDRGTNGPSQMFDREFFDAVFGENIDEIGRANQDSKEDNIYRLNFTLEDDPLDTLENWTTCQSVRWCYYELNLFGDPTVTLKPAVAPEHDIKVTNFVAPDYVIPGESFDAIAYILNVGTSYEYNVPVTIFVDGVEDHTYNIPIMAPPPYGSPVYIVYSPDDGLYYGEYNITVVAGPVSGEDRTWDNQRTEWVISDHPPEQPVRPWGPANPKVGEMCTYRSYTNDTDTEDGDYLRFRWKWTTSSIPIPGPWSWSTYSSEEIVSRLHIWFSKGDKMVQVQTVDSYGLLSEWSEPLYVNVHKSPWDIDAFLRYINRFLVTDMLESVSYSDDIDMIRLLNDRIYLGDILG